MGNLNNFNGIVMDSIDMDAVKKQQEEARRKELEKIASEEAMNRVTSGLTKIDGGENIYGIERPDTYLMRNSEGQLDDRFKSSVGDSAKKITSYGNTLGQDADSREQMQLARSYEDLRNMAYDDSYANNLRTKQFGQIDRDNSANLANIQNQMAMRGGLGSGAGERMAMNAGRNALYAKQGAGLDIAMQDDARRRQLLGQVGQAETGINQFNANNFANQQNRRLDALRLGSSVEQAVNADNVGAMRNDLQNQNLAAHNIYSEDMAAWAAKETADGQRQAARSNSCFVEGTKVCMEDGTKMAVEDVELGDVLELGGAVYTVIESLVTAYYNYKGVKVTGSHAVLVDGEWKRVEDCKEAVLVDKPATVYCFSNEAHRIKVGDIIFADYEEVDNHDEYTPDECLKILNEEA